MGEAMTTAGTLVRHYAARELLECAEREVKLRQRVYANRVLTHRMSQHQADRFRLARDLDQNP